MKHRLRCVFCSGLLALVPAASASAQTILGELRAGVLAHDIPFLANQKEHGVDLNGEVLFVSPVPNGVVAGINPKFRWLLTPRPNFGIDVNTGGYTSQLYFGLTWTAELFSDVLWPHDCIFVSLGFGPAFNSGHTNTASSNHKSLGSNVLFHPSVEVGYWFNPRYSVSLYYEHSSNAGLASENEGLNNAGIRFGLGF